ncbi:MAG: tetratricopeptide repeat protein [Zhaonellaceae bacterium]|jgi:tetratricopeptide (TPR) repeat protein
MLKFLRNNKRFAKTFLVVLIASLCLGVIVPVVLWLLPEDDHEAASLEAYINAEILAMEEELLNYEEMVADNPEDGEAWVHKANLEYDLGSLLYDINRVDEGVSYFKEATVSYQEAIKHKEEDVQVITDLATAALYSNQNELAEESFKKAIEKDPGYIHARVNYGIFLYNVKNDKQGALKEWEAALATNPENEEVVKGIESLIALVKEE